MFTVTYESRSLNNKRRDQKENEITLASRKKETEILFSLGNCDYFFRACLVGWEKKKIVGSNIIFSNALKNILSKIKRKLNEKTY